MITLLSPKSVFRATLIEADNGIHVVIRRVGNVRFQMEPITTATIDAPMHLVRDRLVDLLAEYEEI